MEKKVRTIYASFDKQRKEFEALQADKNDMEELRQWEEKIKKQSK